MDKQSEMGLADESAKESFSSLERGDYDCRIERADQLVDPVLAYAA